VRVKRVQRGGRCEKQRAVEVSVGSEEHAARLTLGAGGAKRGGCARSHAAAGCASCCAPLASRRRLLPCPDAVQLPRDICLFHRLAQMPAVQRSELTLIWARDL
jgi:hypothetical protein